VAPVANLCHGHDMTESSATTPVVAAREDTRTNGPMTGGERAVLDHWLDLYRDTVLLKIAGLDAEQLTRRAVPPSSLSLVGIVRHLTEVEAYWLREVLLDEEDLPSRYCTAANRDVDVAAYEAELVTTRSNATAWTDLSVPVRGRRHGEQVNLRWILVHLVEEYARHLGQMDLLRQAIDGRAGY
jgi:uncharacterized damage-inducible protein DinB